MLNLLIKIPEEIYKNALEIPDTLCDGVWLGIKNGIIIESCNTVSYNDDFATALEKISKYEDKRKACEEEAFAKYKKTKEVIV